MTTWIIMYNKVTLNNPVTAANVFPITTFKHFPKYFNFTLGDYNLKLWVEKSLTLIKDEDMSLIDLACECGFFEQCHFI